MDVAALLGLGPDQLRDQVAVVIGAGSDPGRDLALALAAAGARLSLADADAAAGADTLQQAQALGARATFLRVDATREADVAKLAMWTLADFGPASLLICVGHTELATRAFLPAMQLKGQGRIIQLVI